MTNTITASAEPEWTPEYRAGWAAFCDDEGSPGRHVTPHFALGFSDALAARQRTMRFADFGLGLEWHEVDTETLAGMVEGGVRARLERIRILCVGCLATFDGARGRFLCDSCELVAA
jgi:hypothetical protein